MNIYNIIIFGIILFIIFKYYTKPSNTIIDVRTKKEWDVSHHPNAIHIPYNEIYKLNIDKNSEIILYCKTGKRANVAKQTLINLGYKNVFIRNNLI